MSMSYREQEEKEISTIRKRTIELALSDADVKKISQKAGGSGLTVAELLQNFIGDLVDGTYSNGSDERMYAEQWFERCWFGAMPDFTFLRYWIVWCGGTDQVVSLWNEIVDTKAEIEQLTKCYEDTDADELEFYQTELEDLQQELNGYWKDYIKIVENDHYNPGTLEDEINKILEWQKAYQNLENGGQPEVDQK